MSAWQWVAVGLLIWAIVAVSLALVLGPALRSCSDSREAQESALKDASLDMDIQPRQE